MTENEHKTLEKAVRVWGKTPQLLMVLEEMSELQKEILKNLNRGKNNLAELIEETVDVEVTLAQLKIIYGIEDKVAAGFSEKIKVVEGYLKNA